GGNLHIQKEKSPPVRSFQTPGQTQSLGLSLNIIIQGRIIPEHLSIAEQDINWILDELKRQNIYDVHDVLLAYFDSSNQFFVHPFQK
ncbi:MAG: YetF domain-containing protein, partial [Eubacteriales bacterium]